MKLLFPVFILLFLVSCSKKIYDPISYENAKITFGTGGGFAGSESTFTLLDNGNLFKLTQMRQSSEKLTKIEKNQVAQIFSNFKMLNFDKLDLNDPGNLYYFIEFKGENGEKNKIVWGNEKVDNNIRILHNILLNTIPK